MTDRESDTSVSSSNTGIYRGKELELMLGYIDKDATICAAWPKIKMEATEIEAAQTNQLRRFLAVVL